MQYSIAIVTRSEADRQTLASSLQDWFRHSIVIASLMHKYWLNKHNRAKRVTVIVPLFIFMGQEEVLHLLTPKINLVLIVAFDRLRLVHRVIQRQQELLKSLHHRRRRTKIHIMDVSQPGLDGDSMMGLHQVHVRVTPRLRRGIAGSSTATITQIIATMVRVASMVIPVSPHALLLGAHVMSGRGESLSSASLVVPVLPSAAPLSAPVPLSSRGPPVIPVIPAAVLSLPGPVIVAPLPAELVSASAVILVITVAHCVSVKAEFQDSFAISAF